MKTAALMLALLLSLVRFALAQSNDVDVVDAKPLPTMDFLLQQVVARAVGKEDQNDNLFDMNYQYTRTRTWEYRDSEGRLKGYEQKRSVENKPFRLAGIAAKQAAAASPPPVVNDKLVNAIHANLRSKPLKVKNYSIPNLIKRFQFTLVDREILNGRPSLVVDFKPLNDHLPVNSFADKFINKAAGRVWIDEQDYAIAQAQLHLTQQVNVLDGVVGAVWKFSYAFTRLRTPEGFWFARSMDWHLEGREVVVDRIVDYHERKLNEQKIVTAASAR